MAAACVNRAGYLRRVLLELPLPEPQPRALSMFANPRPVRDIVGANAMLKDPLSVALARGHGTALKAETADRITASICSVLTDAGNARHVPRPSTTETLCYSIPALEAALSLDDCRCVLPAARDALRQAYSEAGQRHLAYVHRLRVMARDLFLACERGDYVRASLMVSGHLALRKSSTSGTAASSASQEALASLGASKTTITGSRRRSSTERSMLGGTTDDRLSQSMANIVDASSTVGIGQIQVLNAPRLYEISPKRTCPLDMQLDPRMPLRVTLGDLPDLIAAAGIASQDDTELRYVLAELGLDYDTAVLSSGVPRSSDLAGTGGSMRMFMRAAAMQETADAAASAVVSNALEGVVDLAVSPKPLRDLYTQPPCLEGSELQPLYEELLKRDRLIVGSGQCKRAVTHHPAFVISNPFLQL